MIQVLINFFKRPKAQPFNELPPIAVDLDAVLDAVRVEMARNPAEDSAPDQLSFDVFGKRRGKRKWDFHDMEVGEVRRYPIRAHGAIRNHASRNGLKFTCRTTSNGLWVRRVA